MAEEEIRFSAGSILLQVVPSLRDAQNVIGKDAKQMGDAMERGIGDGMEKGAKRGSATVKKELDKAAAEAKKAGQKAGEGFADAYQKIVKTKLDSAVKAIGKTTDASLLGLQNRLKQLSRDSAQVGITIDPTEFELRLRDATRQLEQFGREAPTARLRVNAAEARTEMAAALVEMNKLDGKHIEAKVGLDGAVKTIAELEAIDREQHKVNSSTDDTANAFRTFNGVLLAAVTIGPALIPVLAGIAGGLALLGPAAVAGVAGIGIAAFGLQGIGDAVKALNDEEDKASKTAADRVKSLRTAQQSVDDAQRNLKEAREAGAKSAEDASQRVQRAEADAAQAAQDSAERVRRAKEAETRANEEASKRQVQAEKRLADAQRDATKAQQELRDARKEAAKDLEDLQDRQRQNALDIRQAVIDEFNATVENNAAIQDPGAQPIDREQASINLGNAQQRLKDLRDEQKDLADEQGKAAKTGVEGTDKVQTAQQNLTNALEDQKQAEDDLKEAAADRLRIQKDGARDVKDAIDAQQRSAADGAQRVADAIDAQGAAASASARSIEDAQRTLARAQQGYTDAVTDTDAAHQKVVETLGKLGPAGQSFALYIHGLRDDFQKIQEIVAAGLFPGLQKAIEILMTGNGPKFQAFLSSMATTMGQLAVDFAEATKGPAFQAFFTSLEEFGPKFLDTYGDTFLLWLQIGAQLMALLAPWALKLAIGIEAISEKVLAFMQTPEAKKMIDDFFGWLVDNAPLLLEFFTQFVRAVVALSVALAPIGIGVLKALTGFLEWISNMDPDTLRTMVIGILAILAGIQAIAFVAGPLAAVITLIGIIGAPVAAAIGIILALVLVLVVLYTRSEKVRKVVNFLFTQWVEMMKREWEFGIKPALQAIIWWVGKIGDAISWLWEKVVSPVFGFISDKVAHAFGDISWLWNNILWPVIKTIGKIFWELWSLGIKLVFDAISKGFGALASGIGWIYDHTLKPILDRFGFDVGDEKNGLVGKIKKAVSLIGTSFGALRDLAKAPISFIIDTVINKGLVAAFNTLADHLPGLDKVDPIPWPPPGWNGPAPATRGGPGGGHAIFGSAFANGGVTGVMPGYTPGRDVMSIHVSGGEAVMRPEWTRAIKAMDPGYIDRANYIARTSGVRGVQQFLGGFKNGGEVQGGSGVGMFDRTTWKGKALDYYTIQMLQAAEKLSGQKITVTQGSYSTSVAASGSTHAGGGAFDLHWPGSTKGPALVAALRTVGSAAWGRNPSQGPWPYHIHGLAIGDPTVSPAAASQIRDYFNGGNGLGGRDDGPNVKKDKNLLGKLLSGAGDLLGGAAGWVRDAVGNPVSWLRSKIEGSMKKLTDQFGTSTLVKTVAKVPEAILGSLSNRIKESFGFGGGSDAPSGGNAGVKSMVQQLAAAQYGWTGANWDALDWIVSKESSWNPTAQNPSSTAYGLFQFLDGTWKGYGKKTSDPQLQAQYGLKYIADRYGSPTAAEAFHKNHGWYSDGGEVPSAADAVGSISTGLYDDGGILPPGLSAALNLTGGNEHKAVFTTEQWEALKMQANHRGGDTINIPMLPTNSTPQDVADALIHAKRKARRGGKYDNGATK